VISVVLVDDHAVVRSGIRLLLDRQDDIEVVGEAGSAKDALFRARALKPDVILLDVVMARAASMSCRGCSRNLRRRRSWFFRCKTIRVT